VFCSAEHHTSGPGGAVTPAAPVSCPDEEKPLTGRTGQQPDALILSEPANDWTSLEGRTIEILEAGVCRDRGRVDAVTPDGGILWLEQDGGRNRRLVEKLHGTQAKVLTVAVPSISESQTDVPG
jgi:hypothetical protein